VAVDIHVLPNNSCYNNRSFYLFMTKFLPDPSRFSIHHHPSHLLMGLIPTFCYIRLKFKFCSSPYSYYNKTRKICFGYHGYKLFGIEQKKCSTYLTDFCTNIKVEYEISFVRHEVSYLKLFVVCRRCLLLASIINVFEKILFWFLSAKYKYTPNLFSVILQNRIWSVFSETAHRKKNLYVT
jgi:hypothetical protein